MEETTKRVAVALLLLARHYANHENACRMNRIEKRFASLRQSGRKGLIVYIGAGDPDLSRTRELALALDRVGVDCLELGVPFSDPLADGVVNQLAAQRGLASGTTPRGVLETVTEVRCESELPLVLYIYFNLMHRYGLERFIADAAKAGVDGILALDLPPEEGERYATLMRAAGLSNICLVAPTTPEDRIAVIARRARGFIYYISREGVTGMQKDLAVDLQDKLNRIRTHTDLPIAVGFGISNPDQARVVAGYADAVVVGSAVVNRIAEKGDAPDLVPCLGEWVRSFAAAVKDL